MFAALSRFVPRAAWANLAVRPDTLLRWHRQLVMRRWTYTHRKPGRPPLERSLRELILRLAHENPHWGYKRIVGELKGLGISVSATSVRKVLLEAGLQPAPKRSHSSWRTFLRQLAASMLACDFLNVETAFLRRIYVLFFIVKFRGPCGDARPRRRRGGGSADCGHAGSPRRRRLARATRATHGRS